MLKKMKQYMQFWNDLGLNMKQRQNWEVCKKIHPPIMCIFWVSLKISHSTSDLHQQTQAQQKWPN